jgi:hypothetical protein
MAALESLGPLMNGVIRPSGLSPGRLVVIHRFQRSSSAVVFHISIPVPLPEPSTSNTHAPVRVAPVRNNGWEQAATRVARETTTFMILKTFRDFTVFIALNVKAESAALNGVFPAGKKNPTEETKQPPVGRTKHLHNAFNCQKYAK